LSEEEVDSDEEEEIPKFDGVEIDVRETEFITRKY
jgi:hypothetical protein